MARAFPDTFLGGGTGAPLSPEARYEQTESISLAFVTALQVLPPRQIAVLIVLTLAGDRICAMTRFETSAFPGSGCHAPSPSAARPVPVR